MTRVSQGRAGFRVETEDGAVVTAGSVVLATGIAGFARIPDELSGLPASATA